MAPPFAHGTPHVSVAARAQELEDLGHRVADVNTERRGASQTDTLRLAMTRIAESVAGVPVSAVADGLAARDIGVRSGHMYSPRLIARLGLVPDGVVRASLVHDDTVAEIARFRAAVIEVIDELW